MSERSVNRHAILVDAGYLLAASGQVIVGTSLRRSFSVDWRRLVQGIKDGVAELAETELLRVLWYDAARDQGWTNLNSEHQMISLLPDVKLRLGRLNNEGAQKGVDTRIALDLVNLGVQHAVSAIYVISGDDDLTEAVDVAQDYGVRVSLFNVPDADARLGVYATAVHLARTVDGCHPMALDMLREAVRPVVAATPSATTPAGERPALKAPSPATLAKPRPAPIGAPPLSHTPAGSSMAYSSSTGGPAVDHLGLADVDDDLRPHVDDVAVKVVSSWLASATQNDVIVLKANRPTIPAEIDRTLLMDLVGRGGDRYRYLGEGTRHELRSAFWTQFDAQYPG